MTKLQDHRNTLTNGPIAESLPRSIDRRRASGTYVLWRGAAAHLESLRVTVLAVIEAWCMWRWLQAELVS